MTVYGRSSSVIDRPTIRGSPPNWLVQVRWLRTTTASLPGSSSSGANVRPSAGSMPKTSEVPGRNAADAEHDRLALAGERHRVAPCRRHGLEDVAILLPVEEVGGRDAVVAAAGDLLPDLENPIGLGIGERLEQRAVHEAEDGAGRANAERQRQDGDGREARAASEVAEPVAHVLPKLVEHTSSSMALEGFRRCVSRFRWVETTAESPRAGSTSTPTFCATGSSRQPASPYSSTNAFSLPSASSHCAEIVEVTAGLRQALPLELPELSRPAGWTRARGRPPPSRAGAW